MTKPTGGFVPRALLAMLLLAALVFPLVSATTYVSFSALNLEAEDLHLYNSTGSLIGVYNTTSIAIPLTDNQSYTILVVPSNTNLLGNHPDTWFGNFATYSREHSVGLMLLAFIAITFGIAIGRAVRRR